MRHLRNGTALAWLLALALAGITGVVSYIHARWVAVDVGNTGAVSWLIPFVPDLLIVTSSVVLLKSARLGKRPWQAWLSLIIGAVVTIVMNVAAGLHDGPWSACVAGLIPVAFILTFETLVVMVRQAASVLTDEPAAGCGHKVATTLDEAIVAAAQVLPYVKVAENFGVHRNRVGRLMKAPVVQPVQAAAGLNGDGHE